ncbi:Hypothetical predicted protein [Podarcis lilfordi]|uniref:Uncharacterized protein n=1 Tax=Podarcis lilfordi TaxID=74358 RepID=A0AA35PRX1_9SAUR|nr:Hypothetical predicted protein [Podarcis lilfordi]
MTHEEAHRATPCAARRWGKPFPSVATVFSRAGRRRPRSTSGSSCRPVVISSAAVAAVTSASSGGGAGGAEGEAQTSSEQAPAASPSSRPRARNAERGGGWLQRPGGGPEAADRGLAGARRLDPRSCCRERREEASQTEEGEKEKRRARDASCRAPKRALERPPSGLGEGRAAARDSAEGNGCSARRHWNAAVGRRNVGEPSHSSSEWACHKGFLRPAGG